MLFLVSKIDGPKPFSMVGERVVCSKPGPNVSNNKNFFFNTTTQSLVSQVNLGGLTMAKQPSFHCLCSWKA